MDGGCINIWLKEGLSESEQTFLFGYAKYINSFSQAYSIRFKTLKLTSNMEKNRIKKAIGYIPKFEVIVCGFADDIFISSEAILMEYEGYLKLGVGATEDEFKTLKGEWHNIKKTNYDYHLIDREFTSNYFNKADNVEIKSKYFLSRFRKRMEYLTSLN